MSPLAFSARRWCETAGLDMSIIAEMLTTHGSQWHSSQKIRTRVASPSWRNTSAMI